MEICGFYECEECGQRFLDMRVAPRLVCPYCGEVPDMEIGPDEEMSELVEAAKLIKVIEGTEEIEKMDGLLSLAITGGDENVALMCDVHLAGKYADAYLNNEINCY